MPWGAEEAIITSQLETDGDGSTIALRKVEIDRDEMTAYHRHRRRNEIILVQNGIVELRTADDYHELDDGGAFFIEAGQPHQIQNIDDRVAELVEIVVPFDADDVEMIEDPYREHR